MATIMMMTKLFFPRSSFITHARSRTAAPSPSDTHGFDFLSYRQWRNKRTKSSTAKGYSSASPFRYHRATDAR